VDKNQASRVARSAGKVARLRAAGFGRWTAEKWRTEADRRTAARAELKPAARDARRAAAAARRADPQGKLPETHRARREAQKARRSVPDPLWLLASKVVAGTGVAAVVGAPHVPGDVWLWSAVAVGAAVIGSAAWLLVAAVRFEEPEPGLDPTPEEAALLARLQPEFWTEHAPGRGLAGTLTARPALTGAGIVVAVRLDGEWTAGKLRGANEHVRALLGCRTGLRMEIKAGDRGGWAELTLRTRSAADGDDLKWTPAARTFGVDTVTGEHVDLPLGERLLIAGMSGAGKSVASRPLLFDASQGDTNALVILDLKMVEGRLWDHRARVASTPAAVEAVTDELVTEMRERLKELPKGQASWKPTPARPRITVVVDEGAEVVTGAKSALDGLETLARLGRAACIDLWWMTQKPTMSGPSLGIPPQIASQMGTRICLAVSTASETRNVLGEDAQAKGWTAEDLPMPGVALVRAGRSRPPHPVAVRHMTDGQVIALPARPVWRREEASEAAPVRPTLRLVKDAGTEAAGTVPAPRPSEAAPVEGTPDARVLAALSALRPPVRQKDIVTTTGLPKGTVSKAVRRLVESGRLVRNEDGTIATAGEVSA
jgi:hypothetical protein